MSCGWDKAIRIHDEESMDGELLREVVNAHSADILCVAHSYELGILATGCRLGEIKVWDYQMVTLDYELTGHTTSIVTLAFVKDRPLLLSADSGGNVRLWLVKGGGHSR